MMLIPHGNQHLPKSFSREHSCRPAVPTLFIWMLYNRLSLWVHCFCWHIKSLIYSVLHGNNLLRMSHPYTLSFGQNYGLLRVNGIIIKKKIQELIYWLGSISQCFSSWIINNNTWHVYHSSPFIRAPARLWSHLTFQQSFQAASEAIIRPPCHHRDEGVHRGQFASKWRKNFSLVVCLRKKWVLRSLSSYQ